MKYLRTTQIAILTAGLTLAAAPSLRASELQRVQLAQEISPMMKTSSQGYLGVDLREVDNDRAIALKLKEQRGAEILSVDHDAPAGKAGLRPHDVILQINGQAVEGVEQLKRILRETPSGRTVQLVLSRDGSQQTLSIQLADRATVEQQAWQQHFTLPEPSANAPRGQSFVGNGSGNLPQGGSGGWFFGGSAFTLGTVVDPLEEQLADFFGVKNGLLVKSVDKKSAAAKAGLKAGDILLKFNDEALVTRNDWERDLRSNIGKQAQITILRDKKQQTITLQVDAKKRGELELPELFNLDSQQLAELQNSLSNLPQIQVDNLLDTNKFDKDQLKAMAEDAMRQAAEVQKNFNAQNKKQMEEDIQEAKKQVEAAKQQLEQQKEELQQLLKQSHQNE